MMMQIRVLLLCLVALGVLAQSGEDEAAVRRKIAGTWTLVSAETTLKDGSKSRDYGPNEKGFLMYSADGYMCAVGMDPDRPRWKNPAEPTQQEKAEAFDGSYGYCGPYEIDTVRRQIIHLPKVSTGPGFLGTRQIRPYRIEGNRLILSGEAVEGYPEIASWKVVWEKVK